jgi:ActR/RegA family two-component response regulator
LNKKARILVVDDDAVIRKTLQLALSGENYYVDTATTAEEAILKSNSHFFHLAIIDYRLPDALGANLLSLLRVTVPRMRMVIITGYPMIDDAIEAINRGVDGYLTKPVTIRKLMELIERQLQKQAEEKAIIEQNVMRHLEAKHEDEGEDEAFETFERKLVSGGQVRLRISDFEFRLAQLSYIFVSVGWSPVSFGGVACGAEGEYLRKRLKLFSQQKGLFYEAVDVNGLESSGLCRVEGLQFEETPSTPVRIKFSGNLVDAYLCE